jgi:hypothetical protein
MARRTSILTITEAGRDQGKIFHIRELPASQAEDWASRLMIALFRNNSQVTPGILNQGARGAALLGITGLGGLSWQEAKPLMDEMMSCVTIQPNPADPNVIRPLIESDIEEVATRLRIREAVIGLHLNFSSGVRLRDLIQAESAPRTTGNGQSTGMSAEP